MSAARLHPDDIEAIAVRVAELVKPCGEPVKRRMLTAEEVGEMHGVSARWVRAHAVELGAVRLGDGPKARLRFDAVQVASAMTRRSRNKHSSEADDREPAGGNGSRSGPGVGTNLDFAPVRDVQPRAITTKRPRAAATAGGMAQGAVTP